MAAHRLFWRIVGRPFEGGSLYGQWLPEDVDDIELFRLQDEDALEHELSDGLISAEEWADHEEFVAQRRWYKPWSWRRSDVELIAQRTYGHGMFTNSVDFLNGIAEFTEVARIDVHNRWRWWHWPTTLIPPLKRWQLTR